MHVGGSSSGAVMHFVWIVSFNKFKKKILRFSITICKWLFKKIGGVAHFSSRGRVCARGGSEGKQKFEADSFRIIYSISFSPAVFKTFSSFNKFINIEFQLYYNIVNSISNAKWNIWTLAKFGLNKKAINLTLLICVLLFWKVLIYRYLKLISRDIESKTTS